MARVPFRTDRRLWALAAVCVFTALGFVDLTAGVDKIDNSFWTNAVIMARHDYDCSSADAFAAVGLQALLLAGPAILLGWALQAVAVVLRSLVRGSASTGRDASQGQRK